MKKAEAITKLNDVLIRKQNEQETERLILEALPDNLEFRFVSAHGYKAAGSVHIAVPSRKDAVRVLWQFPPLPLSIVKMGTLSIQPTETVSNEMREASETYHEIMPWTFEAEKLQAYPVRTSLKWWTRLSGLRVQIKAEINEDSVEYRPVHRGKTDRSTIERWDTEGLPKGEQTKWWAGYDDKGSAQPNNISVWWYVGQVESIEDALGLGVKA